MSPEWTTTKVIIQAVAGFFGAHAAGTAAHEHRFGFIGRGLIRLIAGIFSGFFLQRMEAATRYPLRLSRRASNILWMRIMSATYANLRESINDWTFYQSIIGRRKNGKVEIAGGHARFAAAKTAKLDCIPIYIGELDDDAMLRLMRTPHSWASIRVPS